MTEFKDKASRVAMQAIKELRKELGDEYWEKDPTKLINKRIDQINSDQIGQDLDNVSAGLFNYPVLMAADILLYGAKYVPVGDDQRQHVEFTRDLAIRMNNKFGDLFVLPEDNKKQMEFAGRTDPVRIRSLRNPEKKMSKSIDDPAGTIMLTDKPEEAAQKVMGATTDSLASIHYDFAKQPGVSNLLQILALISERSQQEVNTEFEGKTSYNELKSAAAKTVQDFLAGLQSKITAVDDAKMMQKLTDDESAMTTVANQTLLKVQQAVGLRPKAEQ